MAHYESLILYMIEVSSKFLSKIYMRTDLKFERRPRLCKENPQIPHLIALP